MENNTVTPKAVALRMLDGLREASRIAQEVEEIAEGYVREERYQDLVDLHNSVRTVRGLVEIGESRACVRRSGLIRGAGDRSAVRH